MRGVPEEYDREAFERRVRSFRRERGSVEDPRRVESLRRRRVEAREDVGVGGEGRAARPPRVRGRVARDALVQAPRGPVHLTPADVHVAHRAPDGGVLRGLQRGGALGAKRRKCSRCSRRKIADARRRGGRIVTPPPVGSFSRRVLLLHHRPRVHDPAPDHSAVIARRAVPQHRLADRGSNAVGGDEEVRLEKKSLVLGPRNRGTER